MSVRVTSVGSPAGDITVIDIRAGDTSVQLLSLGAAIRQVEIPDRAGRIGPVHLALPMVADYADRARNPHLGATLGRYANRIAGGSFSLDGTTYPLDVNNGPNTLHGGAWGWDRYTWSVDIDEGPEGTAVEFAHVSPDRDMGFPGAMVATATYGVSPGRIAMTYTAATDAPTVVSMANHGYWNLAGSDSIAGHSLSVRADRRLRMNADQIPVDIVSVEGTPYDLRTPTLLGPVIEATGGLDDCYVIEGSGLREAARLHCPANGRTLTLHTDAPGLQAYTGNGLHAPFAVHQSISLEAQRMPDAPNQPRLGDCVLRPGEEYRSTTVVHFGVDE